MKFKEKEITLKDGRKCILCPTSPKYAAEMIEYMTELAAQIGWDQVDLEVVAENAGAQALYKKCGFIETGRRHNALRFDDGTYHDEILMYKKLKDE